MSEHVVDDAAILAGKRRHEAIALKAAKDAGAVLTEEEESRMAQGLEATAAPVLTELEQLELRETDGPKLSKAEKARLKELRDGPQTELNEE